MIITYTWKQVAEIRERMDPEYWDPAFDEPVQEMRRSGWEIKTIADVLDGNSVISSDHVRASRNELTGDQFIPEYYTVKGFLPTGYDTSRLEHCSDNAYERLERSQLRDGDLLMANSGKGSVGKICVVQQPGERACVGDLFVLRLSDASPYWLAAFLKTQYGQAQIARIEHGVSRMTHLSSADVENLFLPNPAPAVQSHVTERYRQLAAVHDAAMAAKMASSESEYREQLAYAQQLLDELLRYVEAIIRAGPHAAAQES